MTKSFSESLAVDSYSSTTLVLNNELLFIVLRPFALYAIAAVLLCAHYPLAKHYPDMQLASIPLLALLLAIITLPFRETFEEDNKIENPTFIVTVKLQLCSIFHLL